MSKTTTIVKRYLKLLSVSILTVVMLLAVLSSLILFVPKVQTLIGRKVADYYSQKLHTHISIGRIALSSLKTLIIEDIYISDKNKDTLLLCKKISIKVRTRSLFNKNILVNSIKIDTLTSKIYNTGTDSTFNYQFLADYFSNSSKDSPAKSKTSDRSLRVENIELNKIQLLFADLFHENTHTVKLGRLTLHAGVLKSDNRSFSLAKFTTSNFFYHNRTVSDTILCTLQNFSLSNSIANIKQQKIALGIAVVNQLNFIKSINSPAKNKISKDHSTQSNLTITIEGINLINNAIYLNNNFKKRSKNGFDNNHIGINNLQLSAMNLAYSPSVWNANISKLSFKEKSGLALNQLHADIYLKNNTLSVNNFKLQTNHSKLKIQGTLKNFNPTSATEKGNPIAVNALVDTLLVGYADLFTLSPSLAQKLPRNIAKHSILINTKLSGTLNHIRIHRFLGITGSSTAIGFRGTVSGLPDISNLGYNVDEASLSTTRKDIVAFGLKYIDTNKLYIPQKVHLTAHGRGTFRRFTGKLQVRTSEGSLIIAPSISGINNPKSTAYTILFETDDLNIGKLLRQDSLLGRTTLNGSIKGTGLTLPYADAKLEVNIPYFDFQKYKYHNISIFGGIKMQKGSYYLSVLDSNLNATINGNTYINGKKSSLYGKIGIHKVNLRELGLSSSPLSFASSLNLQLDNFDLDSLNAKLYADSLKITNNGISIKVDTLQVVARAEQDNRSVSVKTDYADAFITGNFKLTKIGQAAQHILSNYLPNIIMPFKDSIIPQNFTCRFTTKPLHTLKRLFPDLKEIDPISIRADLNTANEQVKVDGHIPKISYGQIEFLHGKITSNLMNGQGDIKIEAEKFKSGTINIFNPLIDLTKKGELLKVNLTTQDSLNIGTLYQLGASIDLNRTKIRSTLLPDIILNGDSWNMDQNNVIEYDSTGLLISNFKLYRGSQILNIASINQRANDPVKLSFEKFRIKTLTSFAGIDTSYVSGVLNGDITIYKIAPFPILTSNLVVANTVFRNNLLGDLSINVKTLNGDRVGTNISLVGNENDILLQGSYLTKPPNTIDGEIKINSLNIKLLEPLTKGMLTKPSGKLSGYTYITGTVHNPKILGEVSFENTAIMVAPINSYIKFRNEKIQLSKEGIKFDSFTILDSADNKFTINGLIGTDNYLDYKFDLTLTSKGFEIVRKKENDNSIIYGPVWIDADAKISGNTNLPKITATTSILPKSKLTIVLPETEGGASSREGVVEFMDSLSISKSVILNFDGSDSLRASKFKGIDLNANIAIDKDAELVLNLSPNSGDILDVQGDAKLNATIDPSGKFSLSGKYQIKKGSYDLNFNGLMQRKFDIKEGSSITWKGAPTDADVNLTASYKVKASPIDLIADKTSDMDPAKLSSYKQKQDFMVYLIVKGDLLKPDITFKIDMPEESRNILDGNVYSLIKELNQAETEQKKQVAALLLLGRFVANNPFVSLAGSSTESTIRQSASRILTDQLNTIADELISGVDLDFNLESKEDFSSGESKNQTNLNVGISKNLSDRVSVYVGSNFELEGANPNTQKTNIAGDVAVEYKLSRDGRYRIKIFRKNEYETVIAGEVVETGVTFNLTMDYNKFKELFIRAKARNQKK